MRRCCCRHRATDTDNAPEAAGRRGGRAAATFAVGVLHDVETRRASRGGRARRRRRPRPQPLQLPLPKKLSLPSCTTALAWRQHASDGELPALLKSQARTEERRADVARGVSSRSAEERRRFASDSIISRRVLSILPLVGQYLAPDGTLFPIATLLDAEKILAGGQWRKHLQPGYWRAARKCKEPRLVVEFHSGWRWAVSFLSGNDIEKYKNHSVALNIDRNILYEKINNRVDKMFDNGLIDEVKELLPHEHLNSLNTIGYKEIFKHFKGELNFQETTELIKTNSRRFAKRQLSWLKNNGNHYWVDSESNKNNIEKLFQQIF